MRNIKKYLYLLIPALLTLAVIGMAFAPSEKADGEYYASSQYYAYTPDQDTITNTESDTLLLPVNFLSSWTYSYSVVLANLSGTTNVAVALQRSNSLSSDTDWKTAATFTGTSGILQEVATDVPGVRHRLILTGSGTQSSTYNIYGIYKKKY